MDQAIVILTNVPDGETADNIARQLVDGRLAACVNILPPIRSIYRWQGQVEQANEITLLIKTMQSMYSAVEETVSELHPYDVPEVISWPIANGLPAYLAWIADEAG